MRLDRFFSKNGPIVSYAYNALSNVNLPFAGTCLNKKKLMPTPEIIALTEKISAYLSEYNDFAFHPLKHCIKGHSDETILAALDELETNETAEFQHFQPKEPDSDQSDIRTINTDELAGRKIRIWGSKSFS